MPANFEIRGSRQLKALGLRLKDASVDGKLRRDMLAGIRAAASEAIPDVRESARSTLPRRGGLAERVAEQPYVVRTSLVGKSGGRVSIQGKGMKELRDIDAGRVRHPVYGNRGVWVQQKVTPGFFSTPIKKKAPKVRARISFVMAETARRIGSPL
jgi:hypothetical protein